MPAYRWPWPLVTFQDPLKWAQGLAEPLLFDEERQRLVDRFLLRCDTKVALCRIDFLLVQQQMLVSKHVSQYGVLSMFSAAHVAP